MVPTTGETFEGIVQFPNEHFYYVSKDHIILRVIQQNWELLGMDVQAEVPRENKYVKIETKVADRESKTFRQCYQSHTFHEVEELKCRLQQ